jgi:hypothetical protein
MVFFPQGWTQSVFMALRGTDAVSKAALILSFDV